MQPRRPEPGATRSSDHPDPGTPGRRIGLCSWSLQARSVAELHACAEQLDVRDVQLALDPVRGGTFPAEELVRLADGNPAVRMTSGMMSMQGEDYSTLDSIRLTGGVRPDAHWRENLSNARANARVAAEFGMSLVTFHAGFLPEETCREREVMIERLRAIADVFGERGIEVGLETGQETAETLVAVLEEARHPGLGVNFDPANMILYGTGDPVAALDRLAPWVQQIHVKDARQTEVPGTWGTEVRVGTGDVDWSAFFDVVDRRELASDLIIEREAGDDRLADMAAARDLVTRELERVAR